MSRRFVLLFTAVLFGAVAGACATAGGSLTASDPAPTAAASATATAQSSATATSTAAQTSTSGPLPTATPTPDYPSTRFGVSLSPLSYEQDDFLRFLDLAEEAGGALRGGNQWLELMKPNQSAGVVMQLAPPKGLTPVIETSFFVQATGQLTADVSDPTVQDEMVRTAGQFAMSYQPPYMGLAVEVNLLEEANPGAFDAFADEVFPAAVAAIKAASPATQVFVTFQLEKLRGLRGGLFGGENDPSKADWDLLDRFPDADFLSFTTYPMLVYGDPSDIPDDYYSEIRLHTDKPIAFTEIGWSGDSTIGGWESDADEQAAFVGRFLEMIRPLAPRIVMWSFLFDQVDAPAPFEATGLFDASGNPRPSWDAWRAGQ